MTETRPDFAGEDFDPTTGARDMDVGAPAAGEGGAASRDVIDLGPRQDAPPPQPVPEGALSDLTTRIVEALKTVYDPEIPVDVYELGLIYKVDYDPPAEDAAEGEGGAVRVEMTLTAPGCPVAGEMPGWVEDAVLRVDGVDRVSVDMTFDPPWSPERMSDEARLELGWM